MRQAAELDEGSIRDRAARLLGEPIRELTRLPGGSSGLTYMAVTDVRRAIVKIATPGLPPVRNRDVLRQARLLEWIAAKGVVAVPSVLGTDGGDPPDVPPMFAMTFAEGDSIEPLLDAHDSLSAALIESRSHAAAEMLAALHRMSPRDVGETEHPTLIKEVTRWVEAFASVEEDLQATCIPVGHALLDAVPDQVEPVVLHGDWRLGNMLSKGSDVTAVIDWEIWSIGDPRTDLAWFELFSDPAHPLRAQAHGGLADAAMLRRVYVAAQGEALPDMRWFEGLVRF
jgi:aminoglycoside phosphotransferase (APT) family kinase protein